MENNNDIFISGGPDDFKASLNVFIDQKIASGNAEWAGGYVAGLQVMARAIARAARSGMEKSRTNDRPDAAEAYNIVGWNAAKALTIAEEAGLRL